MAARVTLLLPCEGASSDGSSVLCLYIIGPLASGRLSVPFSSTAIVVSSTSLLRGDPPDLLRGGSVLRWFSVRRCCSFRGSHPMVLLEAAGCFRPSSGAGALFSWFGWQLDPFGRRFRWCCSAAVSSPTHLFHRLSPLPLFSCAPSSVSFFEV